MIQLKLYLIALCQDYLLHHTIEQTSHTHKQLSRMLTGKQRYTYTVFLLKHGYYIKLSSSDVNHRPKVLIS